MGFFNKVFKSDCEGLIEAYLQTYRNIKNSPQFQVAAASFEEDTKLPREAHYANTTVAARRYNRDKLEAVMGLFMAGIKANIDQTKSLNETQLLIALLKAAHLVEAGNNINRNFDEIAENSIGRFFSKYELSDKIDIQGFEEVFSGKR